MLSFAAGCTPASVATYRPVFQNENAHVLTKPVALVSHPGDQIHPTLDGSGQWIAYAAQVAGNLDIYLQSADPNATPRRLTQHSTQDSSPVFSPDGGSILWVSKRGDVKGDLWRMDLDGENQEKLTSREAAESAPYFHPDGVHVFYTSHGKGRKRPEIRSLNIETRESKTVVKTGWDPALDSTGRLLVYVSVEPGEVIARLYIRDLKSGKTRPLTQSNYPEGLPRVLQTPSGEQEVVFVRFVDDINGDGETDANDTPSLWSIPLLKDLHSPRPPPTPRPLTPVLDGEIFVHPSTNWFAYTARGLGDLDILVLPWSGMVKPTVPTQVLLQTAATHSQDAIRRFIYRHIIATAPAESGLAHYQLAQEYAHIGSLTRALAVLEEALRLARTDEEGWILTLEIAHLKLRQALGEDAVIRTDKVAKILREGELTATQAQKSQNANIRTRGELFLAEAAQLRGDTKKAYSLWEKLHTDDNATPHCRARSILGLLTLALDMHDLRAAGQLAAQLAEPLFAGEVFTRDIGITLWLEAVAADALQNPFGRLDDIIHAHRQQASIASRASLLLASHQRKVGDIQGAQQRLENLVTQWPAPSATLKEALSLLVDAAIENNDFETALVTLDKLIKLFPSDRVASTKARRIVSRVGLQEAEQAQRTGNQPLARKLYHRLIRTQENNAAAHRRYVLLSAETNKITAAHDFYRRAILNNPRNRFAHYGLGMVLTFLAPANLERAQEHFETALQANARFPEAHLALGWVRMQRDRHEAGQGFLEQAIESFQTGKDFVDAKNFPELWSAFQLNEGNALMALGKTDAAFAAFLRREQSGVPFKNPHRELLFREQFGRAAMHEETWDVALDATQSALKLSNTLSGQPRRKDLLARLASLHFVLGNYPRALRSYEKAIDANSDAPPTKRVPLMRGLAAAHAMVGNTKTAATVYNQVLELLAATPGSYLPSPNQVPWFYQEVPVNPDDVTGAIHGFDRTQERALAAQGLTRLSQEGGQWSQARKFAQNCVDSLKDRSSQSANPERVELEHLFALNHLAVLHARSSNHEEALGAWSYALDIAVKLRLPAKVLTVLESLQMLSVETGAGLKNTTRWTQIATTQLENSDMPGELQERYHRYLVMAHAQFALGTTQAEISPVIQSALGSIQSMDERAKALISARLHAEHLTTPGVKQTLLKQLSTQPVGTLKLEERLQRFVRTSQGPLGQADNQILSDALRELDPSEHLDLLYQTIERWRLRSVSNGRILRVSAAKNRRNSTNLMQAYHDGVVLPLASVHQALSQRQGFIQAVSDRGGNTLWLWHHGGTTRATKQNATLETWLQNATVTQLYLDIASLSQESRKNLTLILAGHKSITPLYVGSAGWFHFATSIRSFTTGSALQVVGHSGNKGPWSHGITMTPEDLPTYGPHHPVLVWELPIRVESSPTPFAEQQITFTQNGPGAMTLEKVARLKLSPQMVVVADPPSEFGARVAVAAHFHLAGAATVVFAHSSEAVQILGHRLSQVKNLGLVEAVLGIPGLEIHGPPGLESHQVVTFAVAKFNGAFRQGVAAFKRAKRKPNTKAWAQAGEHFTTILETLEVLTGSEAKELLGNLTLLPELQDNPTLRNVARVLPKQGAKLQLVARDKLASIRAFQGEFAQAVALRELLTSAYATRGNHKLAATSLQETGNIHLAAQDKERAVESFRSCAAFSAMAKLPIRQARCLTKAAKVLQKLGRAQVAKRELRDAIALFSAAKSGEESDAHRALGYIFESSLSDYKAAQAAYERALSLANHHSQEVAATLIKLDLIRLLRTGGHYNLARLKLRDLLDKENFAEPVDTLPLHLELAKVAWYQGDYTLAQSEQKHALSLARQYALVFQEIQARSLGGLINMSQGKLQDAKLAMQNALRLAERTGRLSEVAIQANNLGTVFRESGRYADAIQAFGRALELEESAQNIEGRAYALRNLGLTHARLGELKQAQSLLQDALKLSRAIANRYNELQTLLAIAEVEERMDNTAYKAWKRGAQLAQSMGLPEPLWQSLFGMGRSTSDSRHAQDLFEAALLVAEDMGRAAEAGRTHFSRGELYEAATKLASQTGNIGYKFQLVERRALRALFDQVSNGGPGGPEVQIIRKARNTYREQLVELVLLEKSMEPSALAQYAAHREAYLKSGILGTKDAISVSLASLQQVLPRDVAIVSLQENADRLILQLVIKDFHADIPISLSASSFTQKLGGLTRAMHTFGLTHDILTELGTALIEPLMQHVRNLKHLVFVLPPELSTLPLGALTVNGKQLIDQFTLSSTPAASILYRALLKNAPGEPLRVKALAPAEDLPFARLEVSHINKGTVDRSVVFEENLGALHLAGHLRQAGHSYFELGEAGVLSAEAVFQEQSLPSLVTLSACESSHAGPFVSLSNAFRLNGARTVVAQGSRVSDLAAAVFMKHFYRHLGLGRATALQRAALHTRENFAHPAHWAGFQLIGDFR